VSPLATLRSHDQYNKTIYGLDDRYRGVFGGRMVVFMDERDMKERGIVPGALVEIESLADDGQRGVGRRLSGAAPCHPAQGSIGPLSGLLLPLADRDVKARRRRRSRSQAWSGSCEGNATISS
jgi:Molydopterin dinucleotide binding domain